VVRGRVVGGGGLFWAEAGIWGGAKQREKSNPSREDFGPLKNERYGAAGLVVYDVGR